MSLDEGALFLTAAELGPRIRQLSMVEFAGCQHEQRGRVLAKAFALPPERFPNGTPSPRALPTAVWINPPTTRVDGDEAENPVTSEPNPITIEAVRSSLEADLEHESPEIPNLNLEALCMAVVQ